MFEVMRGTAKGGKVAEKVSVAIQETINWVINNQVEVKTNDTLLVTNNYYSYALLMVFPGEHGSNKDWVFMEALGAQMTTVLKEWLQTVTGVFVLDEYIEGLKPEFARFVEDLKNETQNKTSSDEPGELFKLSKTYASEKVTDDITEYFDRSDPDFKSLIEIQCSKIREVTA
jgi:hypothetical protein